MRLRELRKREDLSMKELGRIFGIAESTVSMYENGRRQPDTETLKKFADYFNVSLDYLLERDSLDQSATLQENRAQQKKPPVSGELDAALVDLLTGLSPSETQRVRDFVAGLVARKEAPPSAKS